MTRPVQDFQGYGHLLKNVCNKTFPPEPYIRSGDYLCTHCKRWHDLNLDCTLKGTPLTEPEFSASLAHFLREMGKVIADVWNRWAQQAMAPRTPPEMNDGIYSKPIAILAPVPPIETGACEIRMVVRGPEYGVTLDPRATILASALTVHDCEIEDDCDQPHIATEAKT